MIPKLNRLSWRVLLVFVCISGLLAYSYVDRTVYTTTELIIVPGVVSPDGFSGIEAVLIEDVDGDGLYQSFSKQNSAFVTKPSIDTESSPVETIDGGESGVLSGEGIETSTSPESGEADPQPTTGDTNEEVSQPQEEPVPEPVSAIFGESFAITTTTDRFPWAQGDETVVIEQLPAPTSDSSSGESPVETTPDVEVVSDVTEVVESEGSDTPVTDDVEVSGNDTDGELTESSPVNDPATTIQSTEVDTATLFGISPCDAGVGCERQALTFSGFSLPEFAAGTILDTVQLRLSLAAQARDGSPLQRFVVSYSLDGGVTHIPATVIDIDGEVSNSINGDHFLVSLDVPKYQADLDQLKVTVAYEGIIADLDEAYVDAVWLEVTSGSFYEEGSAASTTDAITYERDLALPTKNELMNSDVDFMLGNAPQFTFDYQMQQNFFRRMFNALFGENTFSVTGITLRHATFGTIDIPYEVVYHEDTSWSLKLPNAPQKMHPGKYIAEITIAENDTVLTDSFEFYWGVLAVNTTKSMYEPNEEVTFNLAALTDEGDTICDADLRLEITSPDNEFYTVPVNQSGSCGKNNVTDVPDYLASFTDTADVGVYTITLSHYNQSGEMVHKIVDEFEVREFVPYHIERTAPTRIYPPAPYDVAITITADRGYNGDIVERVPRGFVITELSSDALIETQPDATIIRWPNIVLAEGEVRTFTYRFDAPDISPYLYLLGPLDMDGFRELRPWQIASDALSGIGWFTGTRTIAGTNLNAAASQMQWSTSSFDTFYYNHSTSSSNERVTLKQAGDYFVSVTLPQVRTDGNNSRSRVGIEVRVNGTPVPAGLGQSGYIRNQNAHTESSSHVHFLLTEVSPNDYIEVFAEGLTTIDAGDVVNVTGQAAMYLEFMQPTATVFAATSTRTVASTNLNGAAASSLQWIETRQDTGFVHSNTVNPENITISDPGVYMVHVNVPLVGDTAQQAVLGRVRLNGVQVSGGIMAQGYQQSLANEGDANSSIHWSGIVVATSSNQILTVTTEQEAAGGTTTVPSGYVGSIFVQKLPATDIIALRGRNLVGGTNWNPAAAAAVQWDTQLATSSTFTHSTSTNSHQITVTQSGDYFLTFNNALTTATGRANSRISVLVNGVAVSGARTQSHYTRNQSGHNNSSAALTYLLTNVATSSVITITTQQEANAGTTDDSTDAIVMLWKKLDFNERAAAPTYFGTPFTNIRFASTTPIFDFQSFDPDGTSDLEYEFVISTSSDFASATVRFSSTDPGFSNTASSSDVSPFTEGQRIRYQLQPGDVLSDLTTYYWRVRARDVSGSGLYGDWSTTQSLYVDLAAPVPSWFQSQSGQFNGNTLVGAISSGDDRIQVDAAVNTEAIIAYGEGTVTTPRYRFWNGTVWGPELNALAVGGTINWVQTAAAVNRDEYTLITLDSSNTSYAQIYSASTSSWSNQVVVGTGITGPQYRGVAVAYESLSGDALAISCGNSPDPVFRVWNGSSWSATSTINLNAVNNCNFLSVASDPVSDEIILLVRDTGTQYEAVVWNGTSWGENRVLGSSALVAREGMAVAYESSGDQAVIVTSNGANNNFLYITWNGIEWSSNTTQALGNDFAYGSLSPDPDSDAMMLCFVDADSDMGVAYWNGGIWASTVELDAGANGATARGQDCEFETMAGRDEFLMAVYSDTTNTRFRTATTSVNLASWSGEQSVTTIEDSFWVQTERTGDGTILSVMLDDAIDDLLSSSWNGSTWSVSDLLETNPSSVIAAPYEMYHMSAKRFQFTQGIARTEPINFSQVPNQVTWGDISFSSTEPFGTDVLVRVRYTASTTCDTYVPNGVLPGNIAGFGTEELPIDISSISTTTYAQICLEATISTIGSASASLNDWALSWVREPKLIQNAYRWYTNLSALTPTDPWPLGVIDTIENGPINSSVAVNINDVVRLRIGLESANVALPTSTDAFKLQFAEGVSCSPSLAWRDVGQTGSTTAVWRGFGNSILGSDWYGAAWPRRVRITVENTLVSGTDITNFPVYVNLDDLPAAFFDAVQSDGDDIRITTADGVTEVPYELVSIDTATDSGELHFRAPSLSTTTDTAFYIYYGNPSASGYAVNATFGRNNVWSNGFLAVYHLDQSPTASAPQFVDSTGNSNGTAQNMEAGDRQSGIVGRFQALDGTNEFIDLGATFNRSFLRSTWQIWASSTGPQGAFDGLLMTRATGETSGINVTSNTSQLGYHWRDAANTYNWVGGPTFPTSSAPFMATLTVEPTRAVMWRHAGSGVASGTNTVAHATATVTALDLGQDPLGGRLWNGGIDEMTLSNVVRSNGWIQTTYNNKSNPTGFYAVASEELIGDGRTLPGTLLTNSDFAETYEENNPTGLNRNGLSVGQAAEWDFVLQNNAALPNTNYCFRLVYSDGSTLSQYTEYPRLVTNAPPLQPELSAPFDNEQLASTSPWFEFAANDEAGNDVSYEIQVDNDYDFSSPVITRESNANFSEFTNLLDPAERSLYTSGQTIRFVPATSLSNGVTYYWRVRARDDNGSGAQGQWSTISSFTVNTATVITTWFQTTGEQFATNNLFDTTVSDITDDVRIDTGFTLGTTTSSVIDYDDRDVGNAWGVVSFNQNITSGSIRYRVEYRVSGDNFALIPDAVLPGNSAGFTSSPISLAAVNPDIYNEIRLVAEFTGNDNLPRLLDWTVTWGLTIEEPLLIQPFDNAKVATLTPSFTFVTADPENQDLQYELQISTDANFTPSSTFVSGVDAGFVNTQNGGDTSPYTSNQVVRYVAQSALTNNQTYWWRTRARDPLGSNTWSDYSQPESFTIDTGITVSTWFQTTGQQFDTNALTDIETTTGGAQVTSIIREVMSVYGVGTGQSPQYRIFDGAAWSTPQNAASVGAQIRWLQLRAAPTRPEYALGSLGTDLDVNIQIYDGTNDSWGNVFGLVDTVNNVQKRAFDLAYETNSGDLVAVACAGQDAVFAVWDGSSWSATSTINLTATQNCDWVQMASDPTSDEIIATFRHVNTGAIDYEAFVWNGSSWGNSTRFGDMQTDTNEGMAIEYEDSGNQAVWVVSNNAAASVLWSAWNGTAWTTATATGAGVIGDHIEWATLRRDVGSDALALCYVDNDNDLGVMRWTGAAWLTTTELDQDSNGNTGRPIDCAFETTPGRDGYIVAPYSDTGVGGVGDGGRYQTFATSTWSGELDLGTIEDSWRVLTVRAADGTIHTVFFDDTNDRYDFTRWNGTNWTPRESVTNPSIVGTPFDGSLTMAAQIYPNFTSGLIRSTPINFSDGSGPRWERLLWNDTMPGASDIRYRLYYQATSSAFVLVPDSALPGNAAGFTNSPVSIAGLDRTIYSVLRLEAELECVAGQCPSVQDWSVEWSEGITVSGRAFEYDGTSTTTSGTVGVVVNGVLQVGKTGTILGDGSWTITNVSAFEGDSIMVFVDGATDANESLGYTVYDGVGDVTQMELTKRHFTVGSADTATTSNIRAVGYDFTDDEDIFVDIASDGAFNLCVEGCADHRLKIRSGAVYEPRANVTTHDVLNNGSLRLGTTTMRVRGSWNSVGTFVPETSTVIFIATTSSEVITATGTDIAFYNLTLGETTGTATFTPDKALDIEGTLRVDWGTLNRATTSISIARDLFIGIGGRMSGIGTTTFDGSGSFTWTDQSASSTNVGNVVIDGTAKTITLGSAVTAQSVTIGADDTLNASGSGFTINVIRNWTNNNLFVPQGGTVAFIGTTTGAIARGTSPFNNLSFTGVGGIWSFSTSTLVVNGNFTIATGTVTMPTGTTTIAGSFLNTGGAFAHNNGEVRLTSAVAGRQITTSGTAFTNAFYDLVFAGAGSWSFTGAATTSRDMRITAGAVTLPATTMTVGGDMLTTGSGSFVHNNGEVILLVQEADSVTTNGSNFNNLRVRGGSAGWYNRAWSARVPITVQAPQVGEVVSNFPVYVNLANLPAAFFTTVQGTGADIRVTTADGVTEVPVEVVSVSTSTQSGQLHFRASSLSTTTNTTFYIYYGNSLATAYAATSTFGRNNVWSNGYTAVYHLEESPTAAAPQYISSTGSTTGTSNAMEAGDRQAAQLGLGQVVDGSAEFIQTTYNGSLTASTWSVWMRADGPQGAYDGVVFSRGTVTSGLNFNAAGTNLGYHWNDAGGTWGWNGGPTYPQNEWFMAALVIRPADATIFRFASSGNASGTNTFTHTASAINDLKFGQDDSGGRFFAGGIDEVRIANVARTQGWLQTEYNNQASTTQFYAVGGVEARQVRTFADTNATILGNYIADIGGEARFPTGVLAVGGSFDNNANFDANNGTVRFDSSTGVETIAAGSSTFATVDFNAAGGNFTIIENATSTVAITLTNASQFTLASGTVLTASGTFSNAMSGTSTTWTNSILRLIGVDHTINTKTHSGDTYGTLETWNDTDIQMWNSNATNFVTASTSSIYSQDHTGIDGSLNIYGNYVRTTGTEQWHHAIDFDGTALSVTRPVNVRVATGSVIGFVNASLSMTGSSTASTTLAAISGNFSINATNTTVTARHFTVANTGVAGFGFLASSTLTTFEDGFFTVSTGHTGIRIDGATINQNPTRQFNRIGFATTTAGAASNVTFTGTTTSFVWFRSGTGNLYGEAFDSGDGNPGVIRFDDSSYLITVSGRVLANNGSTIVGAPVCNGTTPNVRLVVDGGTFVASTTCAAATGLYTFTNVSFTGDPKITVYLNTNGGTHGTVVTKTPTANITNLDLYTNQVILRHEGSAPMSIADLVLFNTASDTDVRFTATTTPSASLTVRPESGLFVWGSSTFTPGGAVTLTGNASSTSAFEGTLTLATSSQFVATGTEIHTLAGRLLLGTSASITPASSTFVFNATTTGKSITAPSIVNLHNVSFTGVGGAWNLTAPLSLTGDMSVATGTVTGTNNITLQNGQFTGNGTVSLGAGTTTIVRTNTLGGSRSWTFGNLVLGDGSVVGTTTPASSATTTILGRLTIGNGHILDAGSARYDLAGTGTVFVQTGSFVPGTSLVRYSGANASVLGTTYYDLTVGALVGSSTFSATGIGLQVNRNLVIGNGTASSTFNLTTSDPVLTVLGDAVIFASSTMAASDLSTTTLAGSYDNNGTFIGNGGLVAFTGTGTHTISAGNSAFSRTLINGTGSFTVTESATSTNGMTLQNHSNFTLATGTTLAVGQTFFNTLAGPSTNFAGRLFFFGGGSFSINASTTNDSYNILGVASGTRVRMWNSAATTYEATGGIYSQDHNNTNGLLHIYGVFTETTAQDHWSFATDFDGTPLVGGAERAVTVAFASGAAAAWTGGSLSVIGSTTASTTLQHQGSGTYGLTIGGNASTNWNRVTVRNINASGVVLTGAPTVVDFSRTDHLVQVNSGTGITVGGSVLNANEARNFTNNQFSNDVGVTGATNVTATGSAVTSWRFTNHGGNLDGEAFDVDPTGDPGYLVWDDSAALITVSGNVYSDEGVTVSSVCNGVTNNVVLRVAGLTSYSTSCNPTTGAYSISNVAYNSLDSLVVYLDGTTPKAAHVTKSPISSISNLHLYERRVIVRHESTDPVTIADMAIWDSSDDSDIPFTAVDAGTDTLTLPADRKLIVWTGKTFAPNGNITISGGGSGDAVDGTFEALTNARFRGQNNESHTIAGSFVFGTGAVYEANQATTTFTTTGAGRTIDVNESAFGNVAFTGSGSWTVTDNTFTTQRSYTQSAGSVTFGSGTTTIGASFNATGGAFTMNGSGLVFTSSSTGNVVRFDDSLVPTTTFAGTGGAWSMTDTNATTTGSFLITSTGAVTLPSGNLGVGGSFINASGTVAHNTSDIYFTGNGALSVRANGSDLFAVRKSGAGTLTMLDASLTLRDDLTIASGTLVAATNTLAIGGSFVVTNGFFNNATGTVLLNATAGGKTVQASTSPFYNLTFGSASGGWTWQGNATVTNALSLTALNSFTKETNTTLSVGGVFTNLVGGTQTTWSTTTLRLTTVDPFTINTKSAGGDVYGTVVIPSADVRVWNSSFATTTTGVGASLYSQDHTGSDGLLAIYGDFTVATTTEHWSFATDFDGSALTGPSQRAVSVLFASSATATVQSGTLNIIGGPSATTTIGIIGTGTHAFAVTGGTFNAQFYRFNALGAAGLSFSGTPTITTLSNGFYQLAVNGGTLIRVTDTALNANASKIFNLVGFNATSGMSGINVALVGSTSNAWRFTGSYGSLGGEAFDDDGLDACGSIRFDNSACLLTAQTSFRWRSDDGGEGAPSSEWFNGAWDYRQRVRIENTTGTTFGTTSVKVVVPYDSSMQSDFDDLRFTRADGVTPVDYWIERFTASTEATVWVEVPGLPANAYATVFMYFGNGSATSSSNGSATFVYFDDFEDNNITEYSGDTSLFQVDTAPVFGGQRALEAANKSGRTTDGIFRTGSLVSQGQVLRFMQYVDTTAGPTDEGCTLFGVQTPGTANNNYAVCLELFGTDRVSLSRNVSDNDLSGTVLASTTMSYTTGWYEIQVDWQTNNRIDVYVYNPSGSLVATTSATDSTYTSGGVGYTFWVQNGAWDSYTARGRSPIAPPVTFGAKQTDGGASWIAAENAQGNGLPGTTRRLRIGIENSGLTVTGQTYRLQYAPKGAAPSCEAVSGGSYVAVPNQASCGSSPVCMQTSANVTDGGPTTDLLTSLSGIFSAGQTVESPSNMTGGIDITQDYYTELEYVITPTLNASDSYCFRVVNNTTPLDFYAEVAELGLQFDPTFGPVTLNSGMPIILTPGATTTVFATGTVTDFNGVADIIAGTSTIYRSGAGAACTPDNNNCYISTTNTGSCTFTNCSGSTCTLECRADIFFHADPTDDGAFAGEEWLAFLEVNDAGGGYDFASALGVELLTLRALTVDSGINYGALEPANNTGATNATTTIANTGNVAFDIEVLGTDLTDGGMSVIPANQQKFATSTFNYSACVTCAFLSSTTPVELAVNLAKPAVPSPLPNTQVYWGIAVPFGVNSAPHTGINVFTPVSP